MTIAQLIARLQEYSPETEVMVLDGFNGGGVPRDLNLGPTEQVIVAEDEEAAADCEGRVGEKVVVLGYGCY